MPRIDPQRIKQVRIVLQKKKVFTFEELLTALTCSTRSARSLLKQWHSFTSYNLNGRYYTLPNSPHFDENGLWRVGEIRFSKHGNLKKTVIALINESHCGLSGQQLGDLLGLSPGSFLHHFRDTAGICREKQDGVYIYFSADEYTYKDQRHRRVSALETSNSQCVKKTCL